MHRSLLLIALASLISSVSFAEEAPVQAAGQVADAQSADAKAAPQVADAQNSDAKAAPQVADAQNSDVKAAPQVAKEKIQAVEPAVFVENLKNALSVYFDKEKIAVLWNDETKTFQALFEIDGIGLIRSVTTLQIDPHDSSMVHVRSAALGTFTIPANKRNEVAQYLAHQNSRNIIQGFQLDITDGQFLFEDVLTCYNGQVPPDSLIDRFFTIPIHEIKEIQPAITRIIYSNENAVDVLKAISNE